MNKKRKTIAIYGSYRSKNNLNLVEELSIRYCDLNQREKCYLDNWLEDRYKKNIHSSLDFSYDIFRWGVEEGLYIYNLTSSSIEDIETLAIFIIDSMTIRLVIQIVKGDIFVVKVKENFSKKEEFSELNFLESMSI